MLNLLFVSIAFPPKSDSECIQTAKYFHYLQQNKNFAIEVVTSAIPTLYMGHDPKLEEYASGFVNQVSIQLKENRWVNFLRNRLGFNEVIFPDSKQSFHLQFKKAASQIKQKPDVIYSRSYPLSSAVMAFKLQEYFNVPWIMHLSDPWADSPLHNWSENYNNKHKLWELKCMNAATYICLTSISTINFYIKKYPHLQNKFLFFPNVYEIKSEHQEYFPHLYQLLTPDKLNIVYTGGMAGDRSPSFFLEPLGQLVSEQPGVAKKLNVIFAGDADSLNRAVFQQSSLPFVHYLGKVSFTEAQYLQQRADMLLVIDNPIAQPEMAMFFPSKLLDYIVAKKRIMAITTKGSATDDVMQDLKGTTYDHKNIEGIKKDLFKAVTLFSEGDKEYFRSSIMPQKYGAEFNAERLAMLIKSVVNA